MRQYQDHFPGHRLSVDFGRVLHYTLPQHDIVRVVNTYQERQDLNDWTRIFWASPDDQSATLVNRDVQFIQTVKRKTCPVRASSSATRPR